MEKGDKVKFMFPTTGYDPDVRKAKKYLKINKEYTIENIEIGSFHSSIELTEIIGKWFNTVHFKNVLFKTIK